MRLFFLLPFLYMLSGCMDTAEVPSSEERKSSTQIESNKMAAEEAKDEYKTLQELREKE
ncbi:MAG TPA: hypothetical protein VIM88_06295 [Sulfurovum sp.]|uniref:hypothetical protein n=1 Tax=Sulfurovum sp. TaxID=1969726 RepID=UPI002F9242DA